MTGISMAGNRVTQRSLTTNTMRGLDATLSRAQRLQEQLSSGRAVSRPSDDPAGTVSSMKLRSQLKADEQYLRNNQDASGRLNVADDALGDVSSMIQRAQELLTRARNAALGDDSLSAISAELTEIRKGVIDTYNTRWLDRPVFGGSVVGDQAVDSSGAYVGDDAAITARVSRTVTMQIDVRGSAVGADTLPALLEKAANDVMTAPDDLAADQDVLAGELTKVLTALGDIGARAAQLETQRLGVDSERLDFTARISENEDVDLPKAIMELQAAQVAYQASLGAAAKVMQTSLLDFLR